MNLYSKVFQDFSHNKARGILGCSKPALDSLGREFQVYSETKWHNLPLQIPAKKDADVNMSSLLLLQITES